MHQTATLSDSQVAWFVQLLYYWGGLLPAVKTLVVMIVLDIASGWLVAIAKRRLNSTTSFAGMCKKAMVLLLVTVAIILEPYANGLPLSMLISLGFCAMEGLSIAENAAALGVWIPRPLLEVLEKMQEHKQERISQKTGRDDALNRNTDALNERTAQGHSPTAVVVVEPFRAEIVNAPNHPVPVKTQEF